MIKLRKEKFLVSLVVIVLIALVIGNVSSLATEQLKANTNTTITAKPVNNTAGSVNTNTNSNTNSNSVPATVNSTQNNTVNNTNSARNSYVNSSSLPYAGSNSSVVFIVIALVVSAIYAYKKITEYNV